MLSKLARKVRPQPIMGARGFASLDDPPVRVAVTGAAGNISYATLFRIASG